jgi:lipopolysaccharide transport system permease protein
MWVIAADTREGFGARVREVWQYRHILSFFAITAVQSLYANTRLGISWLFIRALLPLAITSFVFGSVMPFWRELGSPVPYFLFLTTGYLAWNVFDGPLLRGSRGLDANRSLLTKLYIPRVILPLGQMAAGLVEPAIIALVLVGAFVYYRVEHGIWYAQASPHLLAAVPALLVILALAFALTLWTSVWFARTRDARFVLRHVIGFGLYFTPVIYPLSIVPADFQWLAYLNPLTAPIELFKWAVFPAMPHSWPWFGYSVAVMVATFALGTRFFARSEDATMDKL